MTERGSDDWAGVIAGLDKDREGVEAELAVIAAERRPLALASLTGDKAAAEKVAALSAHEAQLRARLAVLVDGLEDAAGRHAAATADEAAAREAARLARLGQEAAIQLELARAVDVAARALAGALQAYNRQVIDMSRLGLDATLKNRLTNRTMISGAMHLAGIGEAGLPLAPCGPSFREHLEAWNHKLLARLLPAAEPVSVTEDAA